MVLFVGNSSDPTLTTYPHLRSLSLTFTTLYTTYLPPSHRQPLIFIPTSPHQRPLTSPLLYNQHPLTSISKLPPTNTSLLPPTSLYHNPISTNNPNPSPQDQNAHPRRNNFLPLPHPHQQWSPPGMYLYHPNPHPLTPTDKLVPHLHPIQHQSLRRKHPLVPREASHGSGEEGAAQGVSCVPLGAVEEFEVCG